MTASALCEHAPSSVLQAGGVHVCSLASRSIHECKEQVLLVCIAFLEALDQMHQRLHLPFGVLHELQLKLAAMCERSLVRPLEVTTQAKLDEAKAVGRTMFTSPSTRKHKSKDERSISRRWQRALVPEKLQGFVSWLLALMKALNDLVVATTMGIYRRVCVLVMMLPGMPTACRLFGYIYTLVHQALQQLVGEPTDTLAKGRSPRTKLASTSPPRLEHYMGDPSLTAVVLEYREKESMVPMSINRRIQRVMHFPIPLRSFEATVRLPPETDVRVPMQSSKSVSRYLHHKSVSPRSIPVSPRSRKRVQLAFSNFSDEVLYQARDRLRRERAVTLTGDGDLRIPRFNAQDCDEDIRLSCGQNCAVKVGTGMYRGVRGTVPIWRNRFVYFEMSLRELNSQLRHPQATSGSSPHDALNGSDLSVAVGLSTQGMPLNTLVGTTRHSIGFYSAGQVLVGGQRRNFILAQRGFDLPSTVGVLVRIKQASLRQEATINAQSSIAVAQVRFSVDGVAVRDTSNEILVVAFPLPTESALFPTLTLHSQHIEVYARFTAADASNLNLDEFQLDQDRIDVWCLDGLPIVAC